MTMSHYLLWKMTLLCFISMSNIKTLEREPSKYTSLQMISSFPFRSLFKFNQTYQNILFFLSIYGCAYFHSCCEFYWWYKFLIAIYKKMYAIWIFNDFNQQKQDDKKIWKVLGVFIWILWKAHWLLLPVFV